MSTATRCMLIRKLVFTLYGNSRFHTFNGLPGGGLESEQYIRDVGDEVAVLTAQAYLFQKTVELKVGSRKVIT